MAIGEPQLQLTFRDLDSEIISDIVSNQEGFESYLKKLGDQLATPEISCRRLFTADIVDLGPRLPLTAPKLQEPVPAQVKVNHQNAAVTNPSQPEDDPVLEDDLVAGGQSALVLAEAVPDGETADAFSGGILSPLAGLNFLSQETAQQISILFCLPGHDADALDGKQLPGTKVKLHVHQLVFIYEFVQRVAGDPNLLGQYLADDRGMGKTYSGLALITLIRLIQLNQRHISEYPSLHLLVNPSSGTTKHTIGDRTQAGVRNGACPCNASSWFGIQCICEPNNPLTTFAKSLVDGSPFLVLAQKALISQWINKAINFFHRALKAEDYPYSDEPFITLTLADDLDAKDARYEQLLYKQVAIDEPRILVDDDRWEDILAHVLLPEARVKKIARLAFPDGVINLEPVLRGSSAFRLYTKPLQIEYKSATSLSSPGVIVFVGQEKVSACFTKGHPYPGRKVTIPRADNRRGGLQVAPFLPLTPALVICDEHHKVHSPTAVFNQYLTSTRDRMYSGEGKSPRFLMMSGTPMPNVPSDIQTSFELLNLSADKKMKFAQALTGIKDLFSKARTQDQPFERLLTSHTTQLNHFREHLQKFLIIRRYGSPYLDRRIDDPRPQMLWYEAAYKTPSRYVDAMREKQVLARSEMERLAGDREGILNALVSGTVKSVQFLLRVAYWPPLARYDRSEIPYCGKDVLQQLKAIPEESNWFCQHINDSYDIINNDSMYDQLGEIVKLASMGRLPAEECPHQSGKPRHVVIYTTSPFLVAIISTVIKSLWSNYADVHRLMARRDRKTTRSGEIDLLFRKASEPDQRKSIVLVTTYDLAGTGLDNMTFFSILIRLGNPWVHSSVTQAIGRIHRPGFERGHGFGTIACFHLYRSDNAADELARCRTADRASLLSSDNWLIANTLDEL